MSFEAEMVAYYNIGMILRLELSFFHYIDIVIISCFAQEHKYNPHISYFFSNKVRVVFSYF